MPRHAGFDPCFHCAARCGPRPRNLLVNGNCQGSPRGIRMVFQPVSGVVDFNLDGVMFPGFFEGYTKWNMVDPAPHLKFKKLLRDIRFFFKWSQPKQAIRDFSAKNPTGFENRFCASGWWFGGSVVEPISRNYIYHLMFYIHLYTYILSHT